MCFSIHVRLVDRHLFDSNELEGMDVDSLVHFSRYAFPHDFAVREEAQFVFQAMVIQLERTASRISGRVRRHLDETSNVQTTHNYPIFTCKPLASSLSSVVVVNISR